MLALAELPDGRVVAGGDFGSACGATVGGIVRWDGVGWSPLGPGTNGIVNALAVMPNGDLVAGGSFTTAGGVACNRIARWNGTNWLPLGSGCDDIVHALAVLPDGRLVAGGEFQNAGGATAQCIAIRNGSTWAAIGGCNGAVQALAVMPNGNLVVGGSFTVAGPATAWRLARWNGSTWSSYPNLLDDDVLCLHVRPNGELVVGGRFSQFNRLARWTGTTFQGLSSLGAVSSVRGLATLPDGDLLVTGNFTPSGSGSAATGIARWQWGGSSWIAFGAGLGGNEGARGRALLSARSGQVWVGGEFQFVDDRVAAGIARLASSCPATAVAYGDACASSGGTNRLTGATLPWTGNTFRAAASGLPSTALVAIDAGVTPTAGLSLQGLGVPAAAPGCLLHLLPTYLDVAITTTGTHEWSLTIPDVPGLVGSELLLQFVLLEFDTAGTLIETTSTNGLRLAIGAW